MNQLKTFRICAVCVCVLSPLLSQVDGEVTLLDQGKKTEWRYFDSGTRPPGDWPGPKYDDAQWATGASPLGYGENDLSTRLSFGANARKKHIAYYFRTKFKVTNATLEKLDTLALRIRRDDGAVIYLNGKEVARSNMPPGKIDATTPASVPIGGATERQIVQFLLDAKEVLVVGENTIAVEVHQAGPTSSDLYLDLLVRGYEASEKPTEDPVRAGMLAIQQGDINRAITLLTQIEEDHPQYATVMAYVGYQLYAVRLGRAEEGLPFVKKAFDANPEGRETLRAYIKTHVEAGVLFDDEKIARQRPKSINERYKFLVTLPKFKDDSAKLTSKQVAEDLDYLEHVLVNCFAYLELRDVDYRSALDAIRVAAPEGISTNSFEICVEKLISLFGDGHAGVGDPPQKYLPAGYAPYHALETKGRVFLFNSTLLGRRLIDEEHPYVVDIDGRPIEDWLRVAGYLGTKGSPQLRRRGALERMPFVTYLRSELGLPDKDQIELTLESEDGQDRIKKRVSRSKRFSQQRPLRRRSQRYDDVGYLSIPRMTSDPRVVARLEQRMKEFRDTNGMVIDLRGNPGGTKDILFTLLPYFMAPDEALRVVELSTYRKPMEIPHPVPQGFMMSDMSAQPVTSARWKTPAERKLISDFIAGFKPGWDIPMEKFSPWHVLALDAKTNPDCFYYSKPLVILQDDGTFSAGDIFLGAFEDDPRVTLMGTPSGGGNGWREVYLLPNSKLPITLCQSAKFRPNGLAYDTVGIQPDVVVEPTLEDLLGKTDSLLQAAIKKAKGK